MRTFRFLTALLLSASLSAAALADVLKEYKEQLNSKLNQFREDKTQELEQFRRRVNDEIAQYMSQPWTMVKAAPIQEIPVDPSPEPIPIIMDTVKHKVPEPIVIKEIIKVPLPQPQPTPIEPIVEIDPQPILPLIDNPNIDVKPKIEPPKINVSPIVKEEKLDVVLYGTLFSIRLPNLSEFSLRGNKPSDYAAAWRCLNNTNTNNLIIDCLDQREDKALGDWAYLKLLQTISRNLFPENNDKATLLTGFLMVQSGYKIRFATDSKERLQLLYSPTGIVFQVPSLYIDGSTFYVANEFDKNDLNYRVCNFKCPGEKKLSFAINRQMQLDSDPTEPRVITIHNHPELILSVSTNRNMIDFYNDYPVASINENNYTAWAVYANTPVSSEIEKDLYPVLRENLRKLKQKDAANLLIHLAESFPYGYDNEIWGHDRAFFMDESWYYPYSDCEDHAIHFTRLIRDLLGLEAVLVCYPTHMAAAVAFTDPEIEGDYVIHRGKRFTICDPTIFYADIGITMKGFNNEEAVLIDLN